MAVTSITVTIGGVPFRLTDERLAERLRLYMDPLELPDVMRTRSDWPGPNLWGLGLPMMPPPAADVGLGCFWYPWGMSRYGIYRGIMGVDDIVRLGAMIAAAPEDPLTFNMTMPDGTGITTPMYVLPPRPLVRKPNQAFDTDGNSELLLYLVTIVDDRFLLGGYGGGKLHIDNSSFTTWASLTTALATSLGITLTSASVDAAYFRPEPDSFLYSNEESAAALLDAVAANIGRVVVRNLDGTYKLQTYADANTAATNGRRLGGDTSGRVLPKLWGGAIFPTTTSTTVGGMPVIVPEPVVVTFPKWVTDFGYYEPSNYRQYAKASYGDIYQKTVILSDLGAPYNTWTPGTSVKIIRLPAKAEFAASGDSTPTNITDVTTLAQRVAKDFYDSQVAALDETYQGIVNRAADGACDVLWCAREETVYTRVTRRPFEWGASHRQNGLAAIPIIANVADNSFWAEITGSSGGGEPATLYSWKRKILDDATDLFVDAAAPEPLTGTNNLKRAPSATTTSIVPNGHVCRVWPSPTDPGFYETGAPEGYVTNVTCNDGELVVTKG
jgi:hypothetical protein